MYIRRCEGDVGVFRLVILFRDIVGAAEPLYARTPGGSNASVAVNPFAPPGVGVGVAMGGWFLV